MNRIASRDRSKRRAVGASACSKLIRQALNEMLAVADQEQALSASDTRPCIEKDSLRRLGIAASDPVVEMMTWWPRTQLLLLLEYDRQTVDGETPLDAIPAKLLDVFAKSLGRAYWAARNCTEPAKFEKLSHELLSRSLRKLNEPIVEQAISLDRLMAIDLSKYDDLVTYPTDRDWPRECKKIRFLQTAVRLGFDPALVVKLTGGFFGKALNVPFIPVVVPTKMEPFELPAYDLARQTPAQWAALANQAWRVYLNDRVSVLSAWRNGLLDQGILREFDRSRKNSGIQSGLERAPIADETVAFEWAVVAYFKQPVRWADVARVFLGPHIRGKNPLEAARRVKRLADQIRKRVVPILNELKLPIHVRNKTD